jgi:transketolase
MVAYPNLTISTDIAAVGKKVVDFYAAKGGEVVSPLVKAF